MTEIDFLQAIYNRLGEILPFLSGIYTLLGFTVVVGAASIVIYIALKPVFYFLR